MIRNLLEGQTAHTNNITGSFKRILTTLERTEIAVGGGYKVITVVQCALQLILRSYDLKLHLYVCLRFSQQGMVPCTVCV